MKIHLKPPQGSVFLCEKRFRVLVAGRRFGKTFLALVELCRAASVPGSLVWYVGPSIRQSKRILWKALKKMTEPYWKGKPNETDLRIELVWGGTICVCGADNFDALRGDGLDFIVIDEFASIAPAAWTEVLRPALADKQGRALFIGTPHGRNHFYDLYEKAQELPDWARFQFTSFDGGNVKPEEIEQAAHEMDERTFRTEFYARFENLSMGRAYYAFDPAHNVRRLSYDPAIPLFWAVDFNVNPLCSVIGQIVNDRVRILDELILPNSNTLAACEEFLGRTRKWTVAPDLPALPDDADEQAEQFRDEIERQLLSGPLNVQVYGDRMKAPRYLGAIRYPDETNPGL
jgi:hypothetical protein